MGALYAFCFAPAAKIDGLDLNVCGWEDRVGVAVTGGIAAVVAEVPLERFEGPEAERNLADLTWLLPRVEAHDRVIAAAMAGATVFPLRFGTLFSSHQALAVEVARRRRTLLEFFTAMDGREEWAVKALLARDRAVAARRLELFPDTGDDSGPAGRGYLLRQRQTIQAEQALGPWLQLAVTGLGLALQGLSESVVARTASDPVVGNWACLVGPGGAGRLHAEIDRLSADHAEQGLTLHCSGPWPLYSFCGAP
jgi:hypothetical protein